MRFMHTNETHTKNKTKSVISGNYLRKTNKVKAKSVHEDYKV